jgi:HSP20 family protein
MDLSGRTDRVPLHPADRIALSVALRRWASTVHPSGRRNPVTLLRFDPFRELDRLAEQTLAVGARALRTMPMEALRRGDQFLIYLDVPGVHPEDIDLTVERNVVSVRARRAPARREGDEVIIDERPYGEFARQLFLGDNLDPDGMTADTANGVLTLTIPVSEASKPRRVELGSSETGSSTGDTATGATGATGDAAGGATGDTGAGATTTTGSETASAADRPSTV